MMYKYINDEVLAKLDDDGISRSSCHITNPDYQAWLAEGNTPLPPDPVTPSTVVPTTVTMRQARLALLQFGLLSLIETAINNIDDETTREQVRIEWEYAATIDRTHLWVQALAIELGINNQLDDLFALAGTL